MPRCPHTRPYGRDTTIAPQSCHGGPASYGPGGAGNTAIAPRPPSNQEESSSILAGPPPCQISRVRSPHPPDINATASIHASRRVHRHAKYRASGAPPPPGCHATVMPLLGEPSLPRREPRQGIPAKLRPHFWAVAGSRWVGVGWGKSCGVGRIRATLGWISVDRGSKATLPLTMPRRVFKSSAKDSARRPSGIALQGGRPWPLRRGGCACDTSPWGPGAPTAGREADGGLGRRFTSLDSDLEAFSHNPAHGSFAPLAFQPSAMTNCVNQRFLSY